MDNPIVCSVCSIFPTTSSPQQGVFIHRRLSALAKITDLFGLHPQPFFPLFKPLYLQPPANNEAFPIRPLRMPYLPKIGHRLNGLMMQRCLRRWFDSDSNTHQQPIILDAHFGYPEGVGCYRVAQQLGLPLFITIRGLEQPLFGTPTGDQIIEALNGCTGVIAVSESLRKAAIQAGANPDNITVIPNGVDHTVFTPQPKDRSSQEKTLVSVGNLKSIKGHDTLLRAFHQLAKTRQARLVIIGGDEEPAHATYLRDWVSQHDLEKRVQFTGSLPEQKVRRWLQAADLFVLASRREGCCNAILEALACGVPVVATDVGDNRNFIHNENGRLVDVDDACQFAKAMDESLSNSWDPEQISGTVKSLSWDRTAANVWDFFQSRLSPL